MGSATTMPIRLVSTVALNSGKMPKSRIRGCQIVLVKNSQRLVSGRRKNLMASKISTSTMPIVVTTETPAAATRNTRMIDSPGRLRLCRSMDRPGSFHAAPVAKLAGPVVPSTRSSFEQRMGRSDASSHTQKPVSLIARLLLSHCLEPACLGGVERLIRGGEVADIDDQVVDVAQDEVQEGSNLRLAGHAPRRRST